MYRVFKYFHIINQILRVFNLFLIKGNVNVMVSEVLIMFQNILFGLKNTLRFAIIVRTNFRTILILVPKQGTKISTVQKLVRTIIANLKSVFRSKQNILKHD